MRYVRDVPADDPAALQATTAHVVAHLSAVAAADDDPNTNADDVDVFTTRHPEREDLLRVVGELDAEPNAPYLQGGFDPLADVDPRLFAELVDAALVDEEVLRGQA
ncbi:hypothetical protein TEK04_19605 [Klenkia sp. LSe6-5]|uniref:Uncharacterized protein n=1 Tax=Klenkia sesuvii TaxID=3103137 RepID=A0ABU8E1H1_9ACTN